MGAVETFIQEMLVLYLIAFVGFYARKQGILSKHTNGVLTQLILYITLPALIVFSFHISYSKTMVIDFLWLMVMSVSVLFLSCVLAWWMRKRSLLPEKQKSVYEGIIIFGNQGFIGYAVGFILFGDKGVVYLTVFNIFYIILMWTYGIYIFSKKGNTVQWRNIFVNPGIISTLIGALIFFLSIRLPQMLVDGLEMVGKMTVPLSMLVIGSFIANVRKDAFLSLLKNRYLWKAAVLRLLVIPLLLIPFILLPISTFALLIAIITSGMPSAPTMSLYAQKYGGDPVFGSFGTFITTVLCMITIPTLYIIVSMLSS